MSALRLCAGVLLVTITSFAAAADDIRPATSIAAVTVYPQGATVVRTAGIDLPAGNSIIAIDDLPLAIDTDSLAVEGEGAFAVASVEVRHVPARESVNLDREAILAEIETIEDSIAAVDDRIGAIEGRRRFLERLIETTPAGFSAALGEGVVSVEQWAAASAAIGEGLAEVANATRVAAIERRALEQRLDEQRTALGNLPAVQDRIGVRISVNAEMATAGTLVLSYRTHAATWVPTYDARLLTGDEGGRPSLVLVRRAEVTQASGEDWTNVQLTLSTTRTAGGTAAPVLPANLVVLQSDAYNYGYPASAESAETAPRPMPAPSLIDALAGGIDGEAAKYVEAVADFGDFRAEFAVPGRVSVESGKGARSMRIATVELAARIEVRAVPMLAEAAYLHAAFVPPDGAPLLAGRVSLFRDGTFVGNGQLPFGRPGRELNLGFGIDDLVRVTRVALDRETGQHGILTTRNTDTRRFRITVDNLHRQPIEISVYDRMPYAEDEKVSVVRLAGMTEPTASNVDDRRGVLAWTYVYEPGQTREILNGFELSWPADQHLVALD